MKDFQAEATQLLEGMYSIIYPILSEIGTFKKKLNNVDCIVHVLEDDASTLWVEWGHHNCAFRDLNIFAMATVADQVQRYYEEAKEDNKTTW